MTITLAAVYAPIGFQGGLDRLALPRVRVHAGRRGHHLRRGRADALADDVGETAARRRRRKRGFAADQSIALRSRSATATARMLDWTLQHRPVVYAVWVALGLLCDVDVHPAVSFSSRSSRHRRPGRRLRHRGCVGQLDHRPDSHLRAKQPAKFFMTRPGDQLHASRSRFPTAASAAWC